MKFAFFKYQGTGNDFIIIDDRNRSFPIDHSVIIQLCDRKFGIGSDGLILIQKSEKADFHMEFYNPDASQSFCGNGSRCASAFAYRIGIVDKELSFTAIDGLHSGFILTEELIEVSMKNVAHLKFKDDDLILNTGSPHFVRFIDDLSKEDIIARGTEIRYSDEFAKEGINVNLVEVINTTLLNCATYERGVENETLSCGTGVTAVALAANASKNMKSPVNVKTKGGQLSVRFKKVEGGGYTDVYLKGPVKLVFKGEITL